MKKEIFWSVTPQELAFFKKIAKQKERQGTPLVLWGWKRDLVVRGARKPESRTVYFSADLCRDRGQLSLVRAYFFLETRAKDGQIGFLKSVIGESRELGSFRMKISNWREREKKYKGYSRLCLEIGQPTDYDKKTVRRRLKGKPRLVIPPPKLIPQSDNYNIAAFTPLALCCGSGLSSESGLPLLGQIHNLFEVDNAKTGRLVFGDEDGLPGRLVKNVRGEFAQFCQFTIETVKAQPAKSHRIIARLYKKGLVKQIFTDNMDDLFAKIGLPYSQTRLSIFPDRFAAKFDTGLKSLLVIGVAVDRRDVIKQARRKGLKIIVINPVLGVAPHSRNMDYLCQGDIFFKEKACQAFPKIVAASGF